MCKRYDIQIPHSCAQFRSTKFRFKNIFQLNPAVTESFNLKSRIMTIQGTACTKLCSAFYSKILEAWTEILKNLIIKNCQVFRLLSQQILTSFIHLTQQTLLNKIKNKNKNMDKNFLTMFL